MEPPIVRTGKSNMEARVFDWKTEITRQKSLIGGLHGGIEKYLELTGKPDKVLVEDLETVGHMIGTFSPTISHEDLEMTLGEFMTYYGYDPVPTDDGYFKKYK